MKTWLFNFAVHKNLVSLKPEHTTGLSRRPNAPAVYNGLHVFVLPKNRSGQLSAIPWKSWEANGTVVSGADQFIGRGVTVGQRKNCLLGCWRVHRPRINFANIYHARHVQEWQNGEKHALSPITGHNIDGFGGKGQCKAAWAKQGAAGHERRASSGRENMDYFAPQPQPTTCIVCSENMSKSTFVQLHYTVDKQLLVFRMHNH